MKEIDVLREIFDKKIISIINLLLDNSTRNFSLSEISSESDVNIATSLRILDKLVRNDIVELSYMSKSKFYSLKQSEKTLTLQKMLKKDDHISEFVDKIKLDLRIKKIILETKNSNGAKLLIVGNSISKEKINSIAEEIKTKYNFRIQFVELAEKQFSEMEKLGLYNLDKKVIWARK